MAPILKGTVQKKNGVPLLQSEEGSSSTFIARLKNVRVSSHLHVPSAAEKRGISGSRRAQPSQQPVGTLAGSGPANGTLETMEEASPTQS